MLLGFIAGILNKYIGEYFEDIDASQLTGSIFGGGVTLRNINLRSNIFENLGIPFHVVAGKCGHLEVQYSLTRLYSEPIVVTLKDLHVLIISAHSLPYNEQAELEAAQKEKFRKLDVYESVKRHIIQAHQRRMLKNQAKTKINNDINAAPTEEETIFSDIVNSVINLPQEATYFDMWIMQVLRNIQFNIEAVHVRFEDSVTKPLEPFAIGLFLKSLQVLTTDSNWKSQYIKDYMPETSYKLVKMNDLSVYWNPAPTELFKNVIDKDMVYQLLATVPKKSDTAFNMLFEPLSAELKVQITPFPDIIPQPFSKPRILIETNLSEIVLNISDKQFKDIIPFLETLDLLTHSLKYRKHRVDLNKVPYAGNYKKWWNFAYNCILEDIQRRRNNFRWSHIQEHGQKCTKYLKAYYKRKQGNASTPKLDLIISKLEGDLDLFDLILIRQRVDIIISRQTQPQEPNYMTDSYVSWIVSWFSYSYWFPGIPVISEPSAEVINEPPQQNTPTFLVDELTPNDKEIIRVAVGFANNVDIVSYPDDYVALEANILLNQLRTRIYQLVGRQPETVMDGVLEKVSFALRCRPVAEGLEVELKMGRVEVYGGDFPKEGTTDNANAAFPLITTANPNAVEYFLKLVYEKKPVDSAVDHKVSLEGLALQFTYLADSIDRIVECFTIPPKKDIPKAGGTIRASRIMRKVMQFRNSPTTKLLRMMEDKGKVELNICLIAPYLVIPQDSTTRGKANFIVVNLGEINLIGTLVGGTLCENGTCSHFL